MSIRSSAMQAKVRIWRRRFCGLAAAAVFLCPCPSARAEDGAQAPPHAYLIPVFYELGMHCTGFDLSYCCVLPPYNSVLAQLVRTASGKDGRPALLDAGDLEREGLVLWYEHERNTFSEGPKMLYWNVPYDVNGNGRTDDPVDSFANWEWSQLFTYAEAPLKRKPDGAKRRLRIGPDIQIPLDHGPSGKPISFDVLDYTGSEGTIVYTLLNDGASEIALPLGQRHLWEALGLPLTALFDGSTPHIRAVQEEMLRPYQISRVSLMHWEDRNGDREAQRGELSAVREESGQAVSFIGTNPVDTPACERCHTSRVANADRYPLHEKEYAFWKDTFAGTSHYYAQVKAAAVSMFEIHDAEHGTSFLANYHPEDRTGAAAVRLGRPPVKCQECHADNILGVLAAAPDPRTGLKVPALTVAVHRNHLGAAPEPDRFGRPAACQICHPAHDQSGSLARYPADEEGRLRGGSNTDIRSAWGGCFLGRDVHSNPHAREALGTRAHLTPLGRWLRENVMADGKGLYCTNCHNLGSRLLYKTDALDTDGDGRHTLRDREVDEIVEAFAEVRDGAYRGYSAEDFFDPKSVPVDRAGDVWRDPPSPPYDRLDDAGDYWLAAGEPKCADCHLPPFVENPGGRYFPVDQEGKYSLMRFSKGHAGLACQACHESTHGLHPVNPEGPDPTTLRQARALNPDGSTGPVKCAACHRVDRDGVPTSVTPDQLGAYSGREYPTRYGKAVALAHELLGE